MNPIKSSQRFFVLISLFCILALSCNFVQSAVQKQPTLLPEVANPPATEELAPTPNPSDVQPAQPSPTTESAVEAPTEAPQPGGTTGSASEDIGGSISKLTGSDNQPGAFPSYHLEFRDTSPTWDADQKAVVQKEVSLSVDVDGQNMHLVNTSTTTGGEPSVTEGYAFDGKDYDVVNGKVEESIVGVKLIWTMWPLDPLIVLGIASLGASEPKEQTVNGRQVMVYSLDTANADPATLEALTKMSMGLFSTTTAKGSVWIDKETGALMKLALDYEAMVRDQDGKDQGTGKGHMEISVSQIGEVKVKLP